MAMPIGVDVDKLQIGTGDVDTSNNTLKDSSIENSDVKVTTNNMTSIEVKDGGTLKYKDSAAIAAEHEQRRKDFEFAQGKAKDAANWVHDNMTLQGKVKKTAANFVSTMDKLTGVTPKPNPNRFTEAANMSVPTAGSSGSELSK